MNGLELNLPIHLDFIYEYNGNVVPVEVKAATNTQAKSYKQFVKKYKLKIGFKASLKNIASNINNETETVSLPLYLLWNIDSFDTPKVAGVSK